MHVALSHEIGSLGLLERDNAAVLNAALVGVIEDLARALDQTLSAEGIAADPFFAQNDGAVMALGHALRFPLLMVGSGPASGMRGHWRRREASSWTSAGIHTLGHPRFPRAPLQPEIGGVRMDSACPLPHRAPVEVGVTVLYSPVRARRPGQ
jgi:hypothetical protein